MPPRKRKISPDKASGPSKVKRVTKSDLEKLICKKKLDALELEESQSKEDRFSIIERRLLLDAYNENGFQVFQDTSLLHRYLPNRRERDLKGLIHRLRTSFQVDATRLNPLDGWQKLCHQLLSSFAKDKRVNLDDVLAEALVIEPDKSGPDEASAQQNDLEPDYPKLLASFASLLMGKFPDNMSAANAHLSMRLFDHIESVVGTLNLKTACASLENGTWLDEVKEQRSQRLTMANMGLEELDRQMKKCITVRDLERDRNIEALCLELPKIKRIAEVLNPLHIDESLVRTLMDD